MKVAIVGTVGIPAKYGGFETLVEYLVEQLNTKYKFTVYCSSPQYQADKKKTYLEARLIYLPLSANGRSSIIYDMLSIIHALFYADTILILGVSGAFMIPLVRFFTKKKVITNIDGLEWKRDKWKNFAKWYLKVQEKIAVRLSHHTIVDNKGIAEYVNAAYGQSSVLIAYGADHVFHEKMSNTTKKELNLPNKYAFKVCRIEPENNVHIILEAFSKLKTNLVIVGNWKSNKYGSDLKEKYSKYENLHLLGPIYDQLKLNELRSNSLIYIHGHSAGGTNPSLVEAMFLGLPIIAFDISYNRYTTDGCALYFTTEQGLFELFNKVESEKIMLAELADNMKQIAQKKYIWNAIAAQYDELFSS